MQTSVSNLRDAAGSRPMFTMDTPFLRGSAKETPITRMLGYAINNPALAGVKPGDPTSPVMTRASNVASLTAAMLLNLPSAQREKALIEIGGFNFTQQVLSFAKNYPGGLGITDAIRFSLALHFLLGILDHEAGKLSLYADGYLAFAKFFKAAQNRRKGNYTGFVARASSGLGGLGSLGKHPVLAGEDWTRGNETPAQARARAVARAADWDQWCLVNAGKTYDPAKLNACLSPPLGCDTQHPDSPEGRRCRGMANGWVPQRTQASYPAPADIQASDAQLLPQMQLGNCGTDRPIDKLVGVRKAFLAVFGRHPNQSEALFYGRMRWCINAAGVGQAMRDKMVAVRQGIERGELNVTTPAPSETGPVFQYDMDQRTVLTDIGEGLQKAADAAFDFLGKTADFVADIMCKGFKALFGPAVGGVMCDIITFLTRMMTSGVAAIIDIVIESLRGVFEFIKLMMAGKIKEALLALLQSMGRTLFSLSAPLMVPILMADKGENRSMSEAFKELKVRADRVVKKQPLWPIMVIMAVVGVVTGGISGSILVPPFTALTQLIIALAPMAATFISEPLKKNIIELRDEKLEVIEGGIEKFFKFALLIFQGAMAIKDLLPKFRAQLAAYFKGTNAGALTGDKTLPNGQVQKANPAERIKYVLEKFANGVKVLTDAFSKFNVKDISIAAGPLLAAIPDLLLAILPDDAAQAMPSLTEWKDAVKRTVSNVDEAEKTLKAGAQDLFKTFTLDTKVSFIKEEVKAVPVPEAASVVAQIVGTQFKDKTSYPKFVAQFRAELLKVP